jgi:hypothetical protein
MRITGDAVYATVLFVTGVVLCAFLPLELAWTVAWIAGVAAMYVWLLTQCNLIRAAGTFFAVVAVVRIVDVLFKTYVQH